MYFTKINSITTMMIYIGILLISILSFFTTFYGLSIIVSRPLALLGSLGLQTAMLGIAWNLIRIRENRKSYIAVFAIAAIFSIFFSYANFDINLKSNTRPFETRSTYNETIRSMLAQYARLSKEAALTGRYQVDRLQSLIELEQGKGWATVVDEGSRDKFIQSIIDGARLTVESWEKNQGTDYHQGRGRGIIINYLEGQVAQARQNLWAVNDYVNTVDSLALILKSDMPVEKQYRTVNKAYVSFPEAEVAMINPDKNAILLAEPPSIASYAETPVNNQQAFMMIMGDLYHMDSLAFFSLMLAIAIDLIVILMALAGGYAAGNTDYIFERVKDDAACRLKRLSLDDIQAFSDALDGNLQRYREAVRYNMKISRIISEYENVGHKSRLVLRKKTPEVGKPIRDIGDKLPANR